jgi:hypothetical protein
MYPQEARSFASGRTTFREFGRTQMLMVTAPLKPYREVFRERRIETTFSYYINFIIFNYHLNLSFSNKYNTTWAAPFD